MYIHPKMTNEEGSCSRERRKVARIDDQDDRVDRMSELCDEILISILSRLSLREATRTSILSSRWRHLYIYTSRLDFPPCEPYVEEPLQYNRDEPLPNNANYISLINSIFDSHEVCRVLKEFKIHTPFMEGVDIERWVEFALTRKVEFIDISILYLNHLMYLDVRREYFTLGLSSKKPLLHGLKSVKKISLSNVQVDDEEVRLLASNSPLLGSLSLSHSYRLRNVVLIAAPHSPLSHLDISHSRNVESIQVCDTISLVSLRCYRLEKLSNLKLSNFSKVTELNITETYKHTLSEILANNTPSDQLQLLKLHTHASVTTTTMFGAKIPELINIKHLELEVDMPNYTYAHCNLIEACPTVEKVEIKFLWERPWKYYQRFWLRFEQEHIWTRRPMKKLSPYLKELKLSGYLGFNYETQLAHFIITNVVGLEKLIVEPCSITRKSRRQATARVYRNLRPMISDSVDLVVII